MADLRFEFLVDKDQKTLTVIRAFAARRQLVWDCHTKSELLDQWFAPKGMTTHTKHMDFREGGYWHFAMIAPDDQKYWSRMDYRTIRPIDGYTLQDSFSDETGAINADLPTGEWDVSFTDQGAQTLVTTVVLYQSAEALQTVVEMGMEQGMASTLERLDELLAALPAS